MSLSKGDKISKALTGRKLSLETRKKMSESKTGVSLRHDGQFQKGDKTWNKKREGREKRKFVMVNGEVMLNSNNVWEIYNKIKIPEGFVIHHKDENVLNDDIKNLRLMRKEDHSYMHQILDRERFKFSLAIKELKERNLANLKHPYGEMANIQLNEEFGDKLI